ncbi:VWA domain-containing protein [Halobacteriaceae archaeon SHR40]|uniref:vWA domain-containing protein n=1 Tax=Halovenus amylolytica TaxID=2500550 RepID=UPI000FE3D1AB
MNTTYTDIGEGNRRTITVELLSRQNIATEGDHVEQLIVADRTRAEFTILVQSGEIDADLETGARYNIYGLLGANPIDGAADLQAECPHCGGQIRSGQAVDTVNHAIVAAAAKLDLTDSFGIIDRQASLHGVSSDDALVDDWNPMAADSQATTPEYVCESCNREVAPHELQTGQNQEYGAGLLKSPEPVSNAAAPKMSNQETVGLATGGAKDVTNFRENIAEEYTPQPEAISDEGLFYDYYFETGERTASDALFAPRYAAARSEHPISGDTEQYLSVGLDSTLSVDEFDRPRLDLVAVLDVSGSMESPFDAYYYDEHGTRHDVEDGAETKLDAATQSLCALTEQLRPEDRLGVVLYNHRAHVAKPLRDVGTTDMPAIRRHIREIAAGGSTNLADGFEAAVDMLVRDEPDPRVERRVVFMTDMMPNTGTTGESELTRLFGDAATDGIHTTFIGMGLDANAELADTLSGIRGANHYFIHSATEFERRLGEEFDYMVTPLVYDLTLELDADGYEIETVHGSPSADAERDQLMHVGTLFPSAKEDGEARGGVVLVRLAETDSGGNLDLVASWTERDGGEHTERVQVELPAETETYAHSGIRKAIALARYADELRTWAADLHERADAATGVDDWLLTDQPGQHERESVPLVVPDRYVDRFHDLRDYLEAEMDAVGDKTLQQEIELLGTLCDTGEQRRTEVRE